MTLNLSTEGTEINNPKDPVEMRFESDNSLQERLRRIRTGKDSNNWLTEALPAQKGNDFGVPIADPKQPKPDEGAVKKTLGALGDVYKDGIGDLKTDWKGLKPGTPEARQTARDFAGRAMLFNQELAKRHHDPDDESIPLESGSGSKQLSFQEIQALKTHEQRNIQGFGDGSPEQTKKLVSHSRPFSFTPNFIETTWNVLRGALGPKDAYKKSGGLPSGHQEHGIQGGPRVNSKFFYTDEGEDYPTYHEPKIDPERDYVMEGRGANRKPKLDDEGNQIIKPGSPYGKFLAFKEALADNSIGREIAGGGESRARVMWKLFLEQGGMDALTHLPLDPRTMILEHTTPYNRSSGMNDNLDFDSEDTDTDSNWMLLNAAVNEAKSGGTMEEMYDKVRRFYGVQESDYDQSQEKIVAARNHTKDWVKQILGTLIDSEGNIIEGDHVNELQEKISEFTEHMEGVRTDILGLYGSKREIQGKKPKALTRAQQRDPQNLEAYDQAIREWEGRGENYDTGRREYIQSRANSINPLKTAWKNQFFGGLGLNKVISRVGGGNAIPDRLRQAVIDRVLEDPTQLDSIRKKWNESTKKATQHVREMEEYRRNNPDVDEDEVKRRFGDLTGIKFFEDAFNG